MCVVRKCCYRSAVIQVKEFGAQRLFMALDPHLSRPPVTWSLIDLFFDSSVLIIGVLKTEVFSCQE